jgi:hypothetical protein
MANVDPPWEPPLAGTEVDHLLGALDRLRTTFRWKADDLDTVGLQTRVAASSLTIGGLLKHLALVEGAVFTKKVRGDRWDHRGTPQAGPRMTTGNRRRPAKTPLRSCRSSGIRPSSDPVPPSIRPSPPAASTSSFTSPRPTVAMPACVDSCAT